MFEVIKCSYRKTYKGITVSDVTQTISTHDTKMDAIAELKRSGEIVTWDEMKVLECNKLIALNVIEVLGNANDDDFDVIGHDLWVITEVK